MIVKNNLCVVRREHLSSGNVLVQLYVWIHVNYFSVSLVSEQKPRFTTACVYLEVWRIVGSTNSCFPVVVTQVCRFWEEFYFSLKNWFEILSFESVSIVDVTWDFSFFGWILDSEVNDGEPSSIEYFFLSFCKQVKELIFFAIGSGRGQWFGFIFGEVEFSLLDIFFFSKELFTGEYLSFGVIALDISKFTSYLSCLASSMSPRYMRSSLVICESRYSS